MIKPLKHIRVENMTGSRGNTVPNQFIIKTSHGLYFQSYDSVIACNLNGQIYLDKYYWKFSSTTGKYRNMFLDETRKETEAKIKSGEYILTNLN